MSTRDDDYEGFYTRIADDYHRSRYGGRYGRLFDCLHVEAVADVLRDLPRGALVLEVACGTGHLTAFLARGPWRLTACDLTTGMMMQAMQGTAALPNRPGFVRADAFALPFPDDSFDGLVSTRFMHLFAAAAQERLVREFLRVLKPHGRLVLDFDNALSRALLSPAIFLYNLFRYRRLRAHNHYNWSTRTESMFAALGIGEVRCLGIAGYHLALLAPFSTDVAHRIGRWHRSGPARLLAEQLMFTGIKA